MHIDCVRYFGDAVGNEAVENIFRLHLGAVHSTVQDRHISVAIVFCCVHIDLGRSPSLGVHHPPSLRLFPYAPQ